MNLSDQVVKEVQGVIAAEGIDGLRVDDLTREDIASLGWSGDRLHLVSVGRALDRVGLGEVEYLVARGPSGHPVAKVGIDYAANPGAGLLMQLATADKLQGLGIATHLVAVAEERIRARGLFVAELGVEEHNPRARALYERLGYAMARCQSASWDSEDEDGNVTVYETEVAILRKEL